MVINWVLGVCFILFGMIGVGKLSWAPFYWVSYYWQYPLSQVSWYTVGSGVSLFLNNLVCLIKSARCFQISRFML